MRSLGNSTRRAPQSLRNNWPVAPMLLGLTLVAITFVAYGPAWREGGFVWDDDDYVVNNQNLRSGQGLWDTWTDPKSLPQYYPLTHTTFWLEYQIWKLHPQGYHATNVGLHALSSLLLWLLLKRLGIPAAWLAAAVFGIHPVHVESVAWITERKNVLSGVFYFAALLAWLRFAPFDSPDPPSKYRWVFYGLTLIWFVAALLSKTVTATLPAAMLVIAWWKCGRIRKNDLYLVAPMFALGAAAGLFTARWERLQVHAVGPDFEFTIVEHFLIASQAIWFYLGKLIWPYPLVFFYQKWNIDAGDLVQYVLLFGAIAVPIVLGLLRHKLGRGPLAAALLFGGTLFPALGFFNVYPMRFSFVADHFQYLASVPMIVLFCAAVYHVLGFASQKRVAAAAALVLLTVFGCLTWRQSQNYRGLEELWTHTTTKNPESWAAHLNLGDVYFRKQDYPKAANCYKKVLDLRPDEPKALYSYGWLLHRMDDSDGGRRYLNSALENLKKQRNAKPYQILYLLGRTWADESSPEKAAHYFQQAVDFADHTTKAGHPAAVLQRDKDALASIRNDLAWIRATNPSVRLRDGRQAVRLAQLACDHARNGDQYCFLLDTLAAAYAEAGKYDLAIKTAEEAIDLAKENKSAETTIAQMESRLRRYLQRQPYRH